MRRREWDLTAIVVDRGKALAKWQCTRCGRSYETASTTTRPVRPTNHVHDRADITTKGDDA